MASEHQKPQNRPYQPAYLHHHELVHASEEQAEKPRRAHQQVQLQEEEVLLPEDVGLIPRRYLRALLYPYDLIRGEHEQYIVPEERQQRYAEEVYVHHVVWSTVVTAVIRLKRQVLWDTGAKLQDDGSDGG